ncbi:unnamed protein product [Microthlaspi erraticum]|uniref:RNase H type-1 domain-containing protein n=1 Tax=Microthlaspi erraticum TaxID=1685480 RepID=A0A6D2IGT4_9BRAS|nr:unnamed protein product [Microthlaspi erraticum]
MWFLAQKLVDGDGSLGSEVGVKSIKKWRPPPKPWLKCNVGSYWSEAKKEGGMAWVLRDELGKVLLHSRRAWVSVQSKSDCSFLSLSWAAESLCSHGVKRVIFASEDADLVGSLSRPIVWPSFRLQTSDLYHILSKLGSWRIEQEVRCTNRGAYLIARGALNESQWQSYVARGHPKWLNVIFDGERVLPSA